MEEIFPPFGPRGSKPIENIQFDIFKISKATSVFAIDYNLSLENVNLRVGSVFETTTYPQYVYEHTKAICNRLIYAELNYISQIKTVDK